MSLHDYLKNSLKLSPERIKHVQEMGENAEELFKELTNATKTDRIEDKQHIDFIWAGRKIDVKGMKRSHEYGYVLIEMQNRWGYHGWCAKQSKAEFIAFLFPEGFHVFDKDRLRSRTLDLCEPYDGSVHRQMGVKCYEMPNIWLGRPYSQDIFTYIRLSDCEDLILATIPVS